MMDAWGMNAVPIIRGLNRGIDSVAETIAHSRGVEVLFYRFDQTQIEEHPVNSYLSARLPTVHGEISGANPYLFVGHPGMFNQSNETRGTGDFILFAADSNKADPAGEIASGMWQRKKIRNLLSPDFSPIPGRTFPFSPNYLRYRRSTLCKDVKRDQHLRGCLLDG
jgi:hypothetical protein